MFGDFEGRKCFWSVPIASQTAYNNTSHIVPVFHIFSPNSAERTVSLLLNLSLCQRIAYQYFHLIAAVEFCTRDAVPRSEQLARTTNDECSKVLPCGTHPEWHRARIELAYCLLVPSDRSSPTILRWGHHTWSLQLALNSNAGFSKFCRKNVYPRWQ